LALDMNFGSILFSFIDNLYKGRLNIY